VVKILLVHQNLPAQFASLLRHYAADPAHTVIGIRQGPPLPDSDARGKLRALRTYQPHRAPAADIHDYLYSTEAAVLNGQAVAREIVRLKDAGFVPDVVYAHASWGEGLYVKDVLPDRLLLSYCEFFYRARGLDCDFDPEFPFEIDAQLRLRTRNATHLLMLEACDAAVSPTEWQRSVHPAEYRHKIEVIHEGVDTATVAPAPPAALELPDGTQFPPGAELVTFVARSLEPYRGFHRFVRALPAILRQRPRCHVIVAGSDEVSYGSPPAGGGTWRERMLAEVDIDPARVHFTGSVPWTTHLDILRASTVHVYLTVPFVLSWSLLEAMSAGATIVASDTAPVREVIEHDVNGLLVDFFSADALADAVVAACRRPKLRTRLGKAARATVVERYDVRDCVRRYDEAIGRLLKAGC
jgi:glycosyltransferase involved in cell wall biosynthesis